MLGGELLDGVLVGNPACADFLAEDVDVGGTHPLVRFGRIESHDRRPHVLDVVALVEFAVELVQLQVVPSPVGVPRRSCTAMPC